MTMGAVLDWHRARPRLAVGVHLAIPLVLLGTALIAQYGFGMAPCDLCIKQRIPYAIIAGLAAVALCTPQRYTPLWLLGFAALYLTDAGIAFFHVGVEQHWWESGCGFKKTAADIRTMYESILSAPLTPCDQAAWTFLGLTMATWNMMVALGLVVLATLQAFVQRVWWTNKQ